ncbi:Sua5 family protein [Babesia ovis]|uniref:Threonylcarbamoyl-AMP synthase n=1 Tax=Babesia ovis TaxID=5869 RepID=A0A9W5TDB8_BABOV|nr:Sua5 family protein [Babesia ovis]
MADNSAAENWPMKVKVDSNDTHVLDQIKAHLLSPGNLISLPTETVYGLAANGLCEESVLRIFQVKGRPLTDPVILHVPTFEEALESIFDADLYDACIILLLAISFSPGPLTIITRGRTNIPPVVSANTGFPAVRCPNHVVAQRILKHVGIPLAAPSANKFGHISPTSADHVTSEFKGVHMYVVDGGKCDLGLESTVLKVEPISGGVNADEFLRKHGGSYKHLRAVVAALDEKVPTATSTPENFIRKCENIKGIPPGFANELIHYLWDTRWQQRKINILRPGFVTEADLKRRFSSLFFNVEVGHKAVFSKVNERCEAPGTILTHYAPSVPTYLIHESPNAGGDIVDLKRVVMIDTDGSFKSHSHSFLYYLPIGDCDKSTARDLYGALREAESVALRYNHNLQQDPSNSGTSSIIVVNHKERPTELNATIRDRLLPSFTEAMFPGLGDDDEIRRQLEASLGLDTVESVDPVQDELDTVDLEIDHAKYKKAGVGFKATKKTHVFSAEATKLKEVLKGKKKLTKSKLPRSEASNQVNKDTCDSSDTEPSRLDLILSASRARKEKRQKAMAKRLGKS